jgi:hypothetical protein
MTGGKLPKKNWVRGGGVETAIPRRPDFQPGAKPPKFRNPFFISDPQTRDIRDIAPRFG